MTGPEQPLALAPLMADQLQRWLDSERGARDRSDAGIAVSVTGIAGPGGSEHKPEGRVCFGIADADGVRTETVEFGPLGRDGVRRGAAAHALKMMLAALQPAKD